MHDIQINDDATAKQSGALPRLRVPDTSPTFIGSGVSEIAVRRRVAEFRAKAGNHSRILGIAPVDDGKKVGTAVNNDRYPHAQTYVLRHLAYNVSDHDRDDEDSKDDGASTTSQTPIKIENDLGKIIRGRIGPCL